MPPPTFVTPRANIRSRGYLPHWEVPDATYHIVFRLADSLPRHVAQELAIERKALGDINFELRLDDALDQGHGSCALRDHRVSEMVLGARKHFDGTRYELRTWCIMPNHAHVLVRLCDSMNRVLHSWKSYTAKRANEILERSGPFWQREYFDRIIRDERDFRDTERYILGNPEKAGLHDWPWRGTAR